MSCSPSPIIGTRSSSNKRMGDQSIEIANNTIGALMAKTAK
ncbi:MAG: hypothetical protein ACJAY2_002758 [Pseudomonadales bacterium]|jgi:hypothetical protein